MQGLSQFTSRLITTLCGAGNLLLLAAALLTVTSIPSMAAGTGFWITDVEALQVIQTPNKGVPLIGGKPTFVRVYVGSNEQNHGPWNNVTATLDVTAPAFTRTHKPLSINGNRTITVSSTGSHRDRWTDSFTFPLDPDECAPDLQLTLRARIFSATGEPDGSSPGDHERELVLNFSPAINLSVYAFAWQPENQDDRPNTRSLGAIKWADFAIHEQYIRAAYPVSHFAFVPVPSLGTTTIQYGNETTVRQYADLILSILDEGSLIHFLKPWDTGGGHGYASGNRSDAENNVSNFRAGVVPAQEIAHSLGLWCHTFNQPCTSPPYQASSYPRPRGFIDWSDVGIYARYPLRLITGTAGVKVPQQLRAAFAPDGSGNSLWRDDPHSVSDIMSYNVPPTSWVSSVTYCQLLRAVTDRVKVAPTSSWSGNCVPATPAPSVAATSLASPPPNQPARAHLYVAGTIHARERVNLQTFDQILTTTPKIRPGPYRIVFLAKTGQILRQVSFGPGSRHPHQVLSAEPFGILVPFNDIAETTARIEIRRGERILAGHDVPESTPTIALEPFIDADAVAKGVLTLRWSASDPGGHPLTYSVEYSRDGGERWLPLAVGLKNTSREIDFDRIAGSDRALLRVRASNGGRIAQAQTAASFRVAVKSPIVSIHDPIPGAVISPGIPAIASGSAVSLEEGAVTEDEAYQWTSDKDGRLMRGRWVVLNDLSIGDHELTLTVQSSHGLASSASVRVRVLSEGAN
jgi:hypothetical protein